jgi:hypothetical protein
LAGTENKKLKVSLKYVRSACIPLSQCFESFESSFYSTKEKSNHISGSTMEFLKLDILGKIDLTLLYSAHWIKNVARKIQLDVIVFFFSRLCCDSAPLRYAFIYVLFKYSIRLSLICANDGQMAHTAGGDRVALQLVPYLQQEIICVGIKT